MAFDTIIDKTKLENGLKATADAIRSKTGTTDKVVWDMDRGFAEAVSGLAPEELNPSGIIPADIKTAAMEIVRKVNEVRKDDSIVFMAMSDSHHIGEQSDTGWQTFNNLGNLHAGMAAKVLSYAVDLDFVCHLGDLTFGHGTTTSAQLHQQIGEMNRWLDEAWNGVPRFQTVGNHDTGMYAVNNGTETETESAGYLFSAFGKYCDGAVYGSTEHGYCYRDFDDKKLRVICLNTSEGDSLNASYECSPEQLLWFAETLKVVGAKSGWNVIVLGHYPLDFYGMHDVTAVVKAYVDGTSITLNGTTVNFSGSNNAKFIANFHGHTHCFKVARLNTLDVSAKTATEYNALRVGIPNSSFYRNNHQEGPNAYGLYFEEETTYDKVNDGVNDTAFVVNVITPSEEVIHSFCYGAGYDRAIGYGNVNWHRVTFELSNCTVASSATSIEDGKPFTATIIADQHCSISSVVISMNGADITSSCYSDGQINIPAVTGDVVIKATAIIALACTNQIPISTDADGAIYGWKKGVYLSSSTGLDGSNSSSYATGFIPVKLGDTVRLKNVKHELEATGSLTPGNQRMCFYDSGKNLLGLVISSSTYPHNRVYENNNLVQFTVTTNTDFDESQIAFFRLNAAYIGDDSIITVNEEIKYADEVDKLVITNALTNVTTNNNTSVIEKDSAYNATITAKSGYKLDTVTVTMGGVDITSSVYNNGVISISSVTGNLVISAYASLEAAKYTNVLPISTDTDGSIYNGKGWKENTYLSSGNAASKNGTYTSGFIPCVGTDNLYFKNVTIRKGEDGHRIWFYDSSKASIGGTKTNNTGFNGFTWDSNEILTTLRIPGANPAGIAFIRFCCAYLGDDSIVTVNEPIE